ncbi:chaplin [Streptomyces pinistramenti]|uniref:chaplin n=1 Tax=Streptomyces pinistramenti TaxID=2884812 RepID=UPI001D05E323|nr:chaplin [Streptomyces pinistramenti]MCB5910325.1 chaplin [Streptomyces pinistramenti]
MKRIVKSAATVAAGCALVLGGAGIAAAGSGDGHGGAGAVGAASKSPGVISGNVIQVPVHVPINVCGNSINVIGLLNPAFGSTCANK